MRILHIVGTMDPAAGGPQEAVRLIVQHAPQGYSSEVATLDAPAAPFLASLPFPVHALGVRAGNWHSPRLTPWLRANRDRFDGILLHGLWESIGIAVLRAIAGHKPYAVFPHGMLDPYFKRRFPAKHLKKWAFWLAVQYWVLRRARRVLFTTAAERDLATQSFWLHRWKPEVVALGAEAPAYDPAVSVPAFWERCPEVRGCPFLLFLGRIDRKKGCDLLVNAFAATSGYGGLHLAMAGPDTNQWRAELQEAANRAGVGGKVHWPGMLQGEAKWGAFAACEAFILPSHQENFGIAVVEALACGKPALLSNQVNIASDCEADGCALVEPDTLEGTRRLLERWMALPPASRAAMSEAARRTFAARYDMARNAETILQVFEQDGPAPTSIPAEAA